MSARKWCFTLQVSGPDLPVLQELFNGWPEEFRSKCRYLVMQLEEAPSTGKRHVQGAVAFSVTMRAAAIKKVLPEAHLEVMRAEGTEAFDYCQKEASRVEGTVPFEHGSPISQGQRKDLDVLCDLIKEGKGLRECAELSPSTFVRAHKGLMALQSIIHPPPAIVRKVGLFVGGTATGKTRTVFDSLENVYTVFDTKVPWFDGYLGQENVLLDECGPGMMSHNFLKRLLDRYPMMVPIKGGSSNWMAKTIVLTSNVPIEDWYYGVTKSDYDALKRRMRVFEFPQDKELAKAWLTNSLIPSKRSRSPDVVCVSDTDSVVQLARCDATWNLYDTD